MNVGYLTFGKNLLCYGLSYCIYRSGVSASRVTEKTAKAYDVILVSVFWWQHLYDLVDFCEKTKTGKRYGNKPRYIVGGFNSINPAALSEYAHQVVVGDGENVLADAIEQKENRSVYTGSEKVIEYSQSDISENSFVYYNEAGIARIELARGCPYRCKFCQLSHIKKYREVSIDAIERAIIQATGKRLSLFAPNKTSHSKFEEIKAALIKSGKSDCCPDVRFNDVEKFYSSTSFQIGIEGISERLRYSVNKRLSKQRLEEIVQFIVEKQLSEGKSPHLFAGFILDLPTESEHDWKEFNQDLDDLQRIKNIEKFSLFFVFNQFMPQPFTPLQSEKINFDRDYANKIKNALHDRKYSVCVRGRLFGRDSRIMSMVATRAGKEFGEIARQIINIKSGTKQAFRILQLKNILSNYGGIDRYAGEIDIYPWDIVKVNN